jgi:hypothetical protein
VQVALNEPEQASVSICAQYRIGRAVVMKDFPPFKKVGDLETGC